MIIAIDGHSSCGKSTLAKSLAEKLDYTYIDTGAMYRAVTYYLLEHAIDFTNEADVIEVLPNIQISFKNGHTILNGQDIEADIRKMEVSNAVSPVSTLSSVRKKLVEQQREMANRGRGIVMDGRDIGTVVFPNARLKIFLTANTDIRAQRRYQELLQKGLNVNLSEIKENLTRRDKIDSNRKDSPLLQAKDAVLLDNSNLSREDQLHLVLDLVEQKRKPTYS